MVSRSTVKMQSPWHLGICWVKQMLLTGSLEPALWHAVWLALSPHSRVRASSANTNGSPNPANQAAPLAWSV